MRGTRVTAISLSSSLMGSRICSPLSRVQFRALGFDNGTSKSWDKFYKRHQNKFFKDRHYLEKEWGKYLFDDNIASSPYGKVVLEVGCGSGSTVFPLVASCPNLFVHACDFSPHAIALVKSHVDFNEAQVNAFVCDVANDDLCDRLMPSSIDVVTLIFMLSAVCPKKMPLILQNIKKVLKPNGSILFRDYAMGDYAQVELHKRNRMISENFYVRGDGTCAFYFSEGYLSTLFMSAGFSILDMDIYSRQIRNRSRNITMFRRWIRGTLAYRIIVFLDDICCFLADQVMHVVAE